MKFVFEGGVLRGLSWLQPPSCCSSLHARARPAGLAPGSLLRKASPSALTSARPMERLGSRRKRAHSRARRHACFPALA
jgi:hypothetical protein